MTNEPLEIDISYACDNWKNFDFDPEDLAMKIIPAALAQAKIPERIQDKKMEISIVLADDLFVQTLNREYRGMDKPTNVLSFASLDGEEENTTDNPLFPLGDIIMAYETVREESEKEDRTPQDHYAHLLVHGTLHLLGYDHQKNADAAIMEQTEIRILKEFNIENPYTPHTIKDSVQ